MKSFRPALRASVTVLFFIALSACGSGTNQQSLLLAGDLLGSAFGRNAPAQDPRQILSRERIDAAQTPLILVDTPQLSGSGTMLSSGRSGRYTSWFGADAAGITLLDDGLLTATRGYGDDLVSSDLEEVVQALSSRDGALAVRVMRYLDGEDDDYTRSMVCSYVDEGPQVITIFDRNINVRRIVEECRSSDREIRNIYWRASDGFIWRSFQFAGPALGYFHIERLYR